MLSYIETQWNSDLLGPQMHLLKSQMINLCVKRLYNICLSFLVWKFKYRKYPCLGISKFFLSSDFKNLKILNGKYYQIYIHSLSYVFFYLSWQRSAKLFCKGSHSKYTGPYGLCHNFSFLLL